MYLCYLNPYTMLIYTLGFEDNFAHMISAYIQFVGEVILARLASRCSKDCLTRCSVAGVIYIYSISFPGANFNSPIDSGLWAKTLALRWPHKQKSQGFESGDGGDHSMYPRIEIKRSGNISFSRFVDCGVRCDCRPNFH